jgi:hypothetical protein
MGRRGVMSEQTDFSYYRTVVNTQKDWMILNSELNDLIEEAEAEVNSLRAQVEDLKEVIKGALKIQSCWLPPPDTVDAEHAGEAQALSMMLDRFKAALSGEGE